MTTHHRTTRSASFTPVTTSSRPLLPHALGASRTPVGGAGHLHPASALRLVYPYPLSLLGLIDLLYVLWQYHAASLSPPSSSSSSPSAQSPPLVALAVVRAGMVVLGLTSVKWRERGGWVGLGSGMSVGVVVWQGCVSQLQRDKGTEATPGDPANLGYLVPQTALLSILEYLTFLLLLRLSPPSGGLSHLSLRAAPAVHSPAPGFTSATAAASRGGSLSFEPSPPLHFQPEHVYTDHHDPGYYEYQTPNSHALNPNAAYEPHDHDPHTPYHPDYYDPHAHAHAHAHAHDHDHDHADADAEGDDPDGSDDLDLDLDVSHDDDASSISDSSIIDLPPPRSPSRIIPPSLSMNAVTLAALDEAPLVGHLVQRTRSARFLGRSWGSRYTDHDEDLEVEGIGGVAAVSSGSDARRAEGVGVAAGGSGSGYGDDYGTFGQA